VSLPCRPADRASVEKGGASIWKVGEKSTESGEAGAARNAPDPSYRRLGTSDVSNVKPVAGSTATAFPTSAP
jgi:hypothetical protein